jgi:hypothetical protein
MNNSLPSEQPNNLSLMQELQNKMRQLVDDFAKGRINRTQFHGLYDRYQRQLTSLMQMVADPSTLSEGKHEDNETTFHIKKRLTARVLGVSIYSNQSGMPIETLGEFVVDPALLVPMLSSYRAATREIFKAGMRSTVMENDQWLCFVPGNYTTLIVLFSIEPATVQLATVERMHRDFEDANKSALEQGHIDPSTLAYPFLSFLRKMHREHNETGNFPAVGPHNKRKE